MSVYQTQSEDSVEGSQPETGIVVMVLRRWKELVMGKCQFTHPMFKAYMSNKAEKTQWSHAPRQDKRVDLVYRLASLYGIMSEYGIEQEEKEKKTGKETKENKRKN